MVRFLLLLALAVLLAHLAATGWARLSGRLRESLAHSDAIRQARGGELVACATCAVHVPRSRALPARGGGRSEERRRFFCSERCRRHAWTAPEAIPTESA